MPPRQQSPEPPELKEIAEALEISVRQVTNLKVQGMPTHTVAAAIEWRKAQRKGGDIDAKLKEAKLAKLEEERTRIRLQNEEAMGRLVSRDECRVAWARLGAAIGAFATKAAREIPQVCSGLPIEKALPIAKEKMADCQRILADHESEFWNQHKEST